jgi:hypothetical protein
MLSLFEEDIEGLVRDVEGMKMQRSLQLVQRLQAELAALKQQSQKYIYAALNTCEVKPSMSTLNPPTVCLINASFMFPPWSRNLPSMVPQWSLNVLPNGPSMFPECSPYMAALDTCEVKGAMGQPWCLHVPSNGPSMFPQMVPQLAAYFRNWSHSNRINSSKDQHLLNQHFLTVPGLCPDCLPTVP